MNEELSGAPIWEYTAYVENAVIRLLVERDWPRITGKPVPKTHTHVFPELFVCLRGKIVLKIRDRFLTLEQQSAAIVGPGIPHVRYRVDSGTQGAAFKFQLLPRKAPGAYDLYGAFLPFISEKVFVFKNAPVFSDFTRRIIAGRDDEPGFFAAQSLSELLMKAASMDHETFCGGSGSTVVSENERRDIKLITELENLIENGACSGITVGDIAGALSLSTRQLSRIALRIYGAPLHDVIVKRRVREAERLLSVTDMPVSQIALAVGYSTDAGLYRDFYRINGTTPSEFRKNAVRES